MVFCLLVFLKLTSKDPTTASCVFLQHPTYKWRVIRFLQLIDPNMSENESDESKSKKTLFLILFFSNKSYVPTRLVNFLGACNGRRVLLVLAVDMVCATITGEFICSLLLFCSPLKAGPGTHPVTAAFNIVISRIGILFEFLSRFSQNRCCKCFDKTI